MRSSYIAGLGITALLTSAAFCGAADAQTTVIPSQNGPSTIVLAPQAPPAPREETPPPPSNPGSVTEVWETGHWAWNGSDWVWAHGQYVVRPASAPQQAVWQPGHWVQQSNGWLWVEGHWQ
jgi:hypothetical protein